jgi:hypothetical protein
MMIRLYPKFDLISMINDEYNMLTYVSPNPTIQNESYHEAHFVLIPSAWGTSLIACNHPTLDSTNCSACGLRFVSCNAKSSIVPILQKLRPGKPLLRRYMRVPQTEQKELVIVLPVPMVLLVL